MLTILLVLTIFGLAGVYFIANGRATKAEARAARLEKVIDLTVQEKNEAVKEKETVKKALDDLEVHLTDSLQELMHLTKALSKCECENHSQPADFKLQDG